MGQNFQFIQNSTVNSGRILRDSLNFSQKPGECPWGEPLLFPLCQPSNQHRTRKKRGGGTAKESGLSKQCWTRGFLHRNGRAVPQSHLCVLPRSNLERGHRSTLPPNLTNDDNGQRTPDLPCYPAGFRPHPLRGCKTSMLRARMHQCWLVLRTLRLVLRNARFT